MARPYSLDLRTRILNDYDDGTPVEDLVEHYDVSRSWLYSLLQQRRETGTIAPRTGQPGRKQALAPYEKEVRQLVADHPDAALADFCDMLSQHISVSTTTLCDFLRRLKITRKKRLFVQSNSNAKTLSSNEQNGKNSKKSSTSQNSFSSMKLGRKRT
jgi:transposase